MPLHRWWVAFFSLFLFGCFPQNDPFLDPSIPRVVTPSEQIAFVRTKWLNGKLQQTTFLDKQNRILEDFVYGHTSQKALYRYKGDRLVATAHYDHSDSSPPGYVYITERGFDYDRTGRVAYVHLRNSTINLEGVTQNLGLSNESYQYRSPYDTLIRPTPVFQYDTSGIVNINRWERNQDGQLVRHFQLYVLTKMARPDTIFYHSRRFSYDKRGRRTLAWFDLMYLGQFYHPAGPDTIRYVYDNRSRLVREVHRYTTDLRNKVEFDTTGIDQANRSLIVSDRKRFFDGSARFPKNDKTDLVEYRYEPFDPAKHLPLHTSRDVGY